MTHYRTMYDADYIGSWDLPPGKDITVTIKAVAAGKLTAQGGGTNKKPIIEFVGKEKKCIINKTNAKTIAAMYGNMVEEWVGKRITLYVTQTRDPSTGGEIDCIRVRPKVPAAKTTDAAPDAAPEPAAAETTGGDL